MQIKETFFPPSMETGCCILFILAVPNWAFSLFNIYVLFISVLMIFLFF